MTKLNNKVLLFAKKGTRGGIFFSKGKYRLHLCGDLRMDGFIIDVVAKSIGKETFFKDFYEVLNACAESQLPIFSLYVKDPDDSHQGPESGYLARGLPVPTRIKRQGTKYRKRASRGI